MTEFEHPRTRRNRLIVEEAKKNGCEKCGSHVNLGFYTTLDDPEPNVRVSQLVYRGLGEARLRTLLRHRPVLCPGCYGEEIRKRSPRFVVRNDVERLAELPEEDDA
jgi:hypothetical protein